MFHVNVFDNNDCSEREFTFDRESIADAFVRGLHSIDSLVITYHEAVVLPSGRTVYQEVSPDLQLLAPNGAFISLCSLLQLHMKSRTRSDNKVITLRQTIKASLKNAPSVAFFDPACDARHLTRLVNA